MERSITPQQRRNVSRATKSPSDDSFVSPLSPSDLGDANGSLRRKGSFSFLRRSKSRDRSGSVEQPAQPQRKLSKKQSRPRKQEIRMIPIPPQPPRIPAVPAQPQLQTFGGENARPGSYSALSHRSHQEREAQRKSKDQVVSGYYRGMPIPPVPPIPGDISSKYGSIDRGESITNRGRYSYASSAISTVNSPRKIRRRKDPIPFNVLVLGSRGCGKTSFVNFLQTSLVLPASKQRPLTRDPYEDPPAPSEASFPTFTSTFVETEIKEERIGVTLWDSDGFDKDMADIQLKEMTSFIESKFEDTYMEESKVARAPGFRDTHIHCVFMILDPARLTRNLANNKKKSSVNGAKARANSFSKAQPEMSPSCLDEEVDLNVLRGLKGKTTVIPIISKADTVTVAHMAHLKRVVWDTLKGHGFEMLESMEKEDDEDDQDDTDASVSDVSTEVGQRKQSSNETGHQHTNGHLSPRYGKKASDGDDFSMTSHLDSASSSETSLVDPHRDNAHAPSRSESHSGHQRSISATATSQPVRPHLLPLSIISPDPYEPKVVGRQFAWGYADPMSADHCDFVKLKSTVFADWRNDLRDASRELWYEDWRTSRLNRKSKRYAVSLGPESAQM